MSLGIDSIAVSLFEKIRARFEDISVGNIDAQATTDPKEARFFNFDYIDSSGKNYGNVTISIIDEKSLKIYFSKNLSSNLDDEQKAEWYDFLRDMRMFAKRNLLSFDTRDISRSNLDLKDIRQLSVTERPASEADIQAAPVSEGRLYGSAKTSYDPIAPGVSLIIRHSTPINIDQHGARSRNIQVIYIQDGEGQRFKSPFTHVGGSRVLGMHVANGGQVNDDFAKHVIDMVEELGKLRKFVRGSKDRTYEDTEANDMVTAAHERYRTIHHILAKLRSKRGYQMYTTEWKPAKTLQDDIDLEELRRKFVQTNFDPRLEDALPHVYRAYNAMKTSPALTAEVTASSVIDPHIQTFEGWMSKIEEGTWKLPDTDVSIKHLQELMSDVLEAGIDGVNASSALNDIIGDDGLYDQIYDASIGSPEVDVRPIIEKWLTDHLPDVAKQVIANKKDAESEKGRHIEPPQEKSKSQKISQDDRDPNLEKAPGPDVPTESIERKYYSVESDSPPFYIHTTQILESARKHLVDATSRGQTDAAIYEIKISNGKKTRKRFEEARSAIPVTDKIDDQISSIRKLAGLGQLPHD